MDQYTTRFDEQGKFSTYLWNVLDEAWKSVKYEYGLRSEIKHSVAHLEIRNYAILVNKCRITEQSLVDMAIERQSQFKRKWEPERAGGGNNKFGRPPN